MSDLTRRGFVQKGSSVLLGALMLGPVATAYADTTAAPFNEKDFDESFDVIVVGSGLAGTTAAIAATRRGAHVLMLESMDTLGGNSALREFQFACIGSDEQKKQGLEDSIDSLVEDAQKIGENYGHESLMRAAFERNEDCYQLLKESGVSFEQLKHLRGHSVDRVLATSSGKTVMEALHQQLNDQVTVRTNAKVESLAFADERTVRGVQVLENGDQPKKIGARNAVILATGSYAADAQFIKAEATYFEEIAAQTKDVNPGSTADILKTLSQHNGQLVNMSLYHFEYPLYERDFACGLMVDQEGKRFVDEANPNKFGRAAFNRKKKQEAAPIAIFDQAGFDALSDTYRRDKALDNGSFKTFQSLEDLAANYNLPAEALAETAQTYAEYVANGADPDFSKNLKNLAETNTNTAPFYALAVEPAISTTIGGARINEQAQVICIKDGSPFAGLYAAGEVTGGVQGAQLLEGNYPAECMAFGMIAGEAATSTEEK